MRPPKAMLTELAIPAEAPAGVLRGRFLGRSLLLLRLAQADCRPSAALRMTTFSYWDDVRATGMMRTISFR
jgi:hypothetical protein